MTSVKTIRSLERGLQVVRLLEQHSRMTLHDLHVLSDLPKATLLRILTTLEREGWLSRTLGDQSYRLSFDAVSLGSRVHPATRIVERAGPVLDRLCQRVYWPSDIAIYNGSTMQIMETSRSQAPFLINRKVMGIKPHLLYSALGRVYLANCPEAERQQIIARLKKSNVREDRMARNEKWLARLIEETRRQGYGVREPGYWISTTDIGGDLSAIAVPVFVGEEVKACINLLWPEDLMDARQFAAQYLDQLTEAARELSTMMEAGGAKPPPV